MDGDAASSFRFANGPLHNKSVAPATAKPDRSAKKYLIIGTQIGLSPSNLKYWAAQIQKVSVQLEINKFGRRSKNKRGIASPDSSSSSSLPSFPSVGPSTGAVSQRLIPTGERSGLRTHIATMESVSLRVRMKS